MYKEIRQHVSMVSIGLVALMLGVSGSIGVAQEGALAGDLRKLVDKDDAAFLLTEIQRVQPYYSIRQLARFQQMQNKVGGGFCGCLTEQLVNADEIPLPVDKAGALETALYLARQRQANLDALAGLGFRLTSPSAPFDGISSADRSPSMTVSIDTSVPTAFLDALSDGEVTMAEARVIAQMPANREMLRFICDRCDGAEPRVSEQTLAYLIWKAGSSDPLDRLWRWVNPMNDFGYAELADHPTEYRELIGGLRTHHQELADAALSRVERFLPYGAEMNVQFAFTPGCLTGDWTTRTMSGSDVFRIKAGWQEVVKRVSAAVYRQYVAEQPGGHEGTDRRMPVDATGLAHELSDRLDR